MKSKSPFLAVFFALLMGSLSPQVLAGTFAQHHPRRVQVNRRLRVQNRRIHQQVRERELNPRQAQRLHHADRRIRGEERRFARHHHGVITRAEQARLNRQENRVSHRIGR